MPYYHVVQVQPLDDYTLSLSFADGATGVVDVAQRVQFSGVFAPLADLNYFRQVKVAPLLGTVCWPNNVDLDPLVLYHIATGKPLPSFTQ